VKRYRAIELVARRGRLAALIVAVIVGVAAVSMATFCARGATPWMVAGLIGAVLTYAVLRIGAEVIEVIAETLLPR
jgi:uncharacterized membrane protein YeaQ/YmgE (transglycosylase-associated protein family)